ncbi:cyclic nucleotide-binding domain-containing protein [Streptomyces aidingensis]|uniref:Cyclic nucleotide-binding domain-containing protein n=1 Tax=Streptomyces aidingensis TaxID=910347 RepID=A0A1I1JHA0_9ACTN|nr:cyclic nucleotide-binding domain-containing protein [Streptomyces aidingensis]SFC47846.1 Cyclic nucleotide-binding domain-containing protein [Streptomyces aidingensis]
MPAVTATSLLGVLRPEDRERLPAAARDVCFPAGARLFDENGDAGRFWIIRTGSVTLDLQVPGRPPAVVETLGPGDLVGWSWLFPPRTWHLGAAALSPVRAHEFDAARVRSLCEADPVLGRSVARRVAEIIGHRLGTARIRLLDLYGPCGGGPDR